MADQIFDAQYQSGRTSLNDGIDRGLNSLRTFVMGAFEALNRSQFASPWKMSKRHKAR